MLPLERKHLLITSGPTRSYLDAIRYVSNTSTGQLGSKIAAKALELGARVTMLYGTGSMIPETNGVEHNKKTRLSLINIETNDELQDTIENRLQNTSFDAIVHAMAVLDFIPERMVNEKTPSNNHEWTIKLIRTTKIIKLIRKIWPDSFLTGFKLEVNKTKKELIERANLFLSESMVDMVVANDLKEIKEGQHKAYVINKSGNVEADYKNKDEIATGLINILARQLNTKD
ncbi:MAG: phosphopantothenoylcysteine decarboxylase domain-containing protein [Candidatus Anammoxibacter sp.]